jgi:hypothetical protein
MVILTLTGQEPSLFLFPLSTITNGDVTVKDLLFKIPESSIALRTSASEGCENLEQPAVITVKAVTKINKAPTATLAFIRFCLLVLYTDLLNVLDSTAPPEVVIASVNVDCPDETEILYTIEYRLSNAISTTGDYGFLTEKMKKTADPEGSASIVFSALTNKRLVNLRYLFLRLDRSAPRQIDGCAIDRHMTPCQTAVVAGETCSGDW